MRQLELALKAKTFSTRRAINMTCTRMRLLRLPRLFLKRHCSESTRRSQVK